MRAGGLAGGANGWLPGDWAAGEYPSPTRAAKPISINWRRVLFGPHPSKTFRRAMVWSTTVLLFFKLLLIPIKVTGASMTPTYRDGSLNFINRLSYAAKAPRRGDIVILRDGEDLILKRVIAVPGERVELDRGEFKINGEPLRDQFAAEPVNWDLDPVTLGANEYFVIGDNRPCSIFGKFSREQILGKIFF